MVNELVLNIVNSVLGIGSKKSKGNYAYHCKFCNHHKKKLEICFDGSSPNFGKYGCWVCGEKGTSITGLFKKLKIDYNIVQELKGCLPKSKSFINIPQINKEINLPENFIPFFPPNPTLEYRRALQYLKKRSITQYEILKHNLGYCVEGEYANMIIIPSYDEHKNLNHFSARSFVEGKIKYRNPEFSKNIIPFEYLINWKQPIIICEGPFDAITIKRNAIPILGKNIPERLMIKIIESNIDKIYIALDKDAQKRSIQFCEELLSENKQVYLVDLNEKDPSDMGFENFTKLLHHTKPITFSGLMAKKINLL